LLIFRPSSPVDQRRREADLPLLSFLALQIASAQEIEELVRPAELEIAVDHHGVPPLHQRVDHLVDADRLVLLHPLLERVALDHARDGHAPGEPQEILEPEAVEPLGVAPHLRLRDVDHLLHLLDVRLKIALDLLARELRPELVAPGGIADHRRRVADDEDDRVPELLDRAQLHERDRVTDVQVGRARIHAELDAEGLAGLEAALDALRELALLDQIDDAALEDGELGFDFLAHRTCSGHGGGIASKPPGLMGIAEVLRDSLRASREVGSDHRLEPEHPKRGIERDRDDPLQYEPGKTENVLRFMPRRDLERRHDDASNEHGEMNQEREPPRPSLPQERAEREDEQQKARHHEEAASSRGQRFLQAC
jgi:hypothetical protein